MNVVHERPLRLYQISLYDFYDIILTPRLRNNYINETKYRKKGGKWEIENTEAKSIFFSLKFICCSGHSPKINIFLAELLFYVSSAELIYLFVKKHLYGKLESWLPLLNRWINWNSNFLVFTYSNKQLFQCSRVYYKKIGILPNLHPGEEPLRFRAEVRNPKRIRKESPKYF
jgi:predicted transglutaminase-like protease